MYTHLVYYCVGLFIKFYFFFQEQKAIGSGGDLMADLHAKLSMRRKVRTVLYCVV
jgi:hypothetical protein